MQHKHVASKVVEAEADGAGSTVIDGGRRKSGGSAALVELLDPRLGRTVQFKARGLIMATLFTVGAGKLRFTNLRRGAFNFKAKRWAS